MRYTQFPDGVEFPTARSCVFLAHNCRSYYHCPVDDAKTGKRIVSVLTVSGAVVILGALAASFVVPRFLSPTDRSGIEETSQEVLEMVSTKEAPAEQDRPAGTSSVFMERSANTVPAELADLVAATRNSGVTSAGADRPSGNGERSGVVPRSSITGVPVALPAAPDVPAVMKSAIGFVLGSGGDVPISEEWNRFIGSRIEAIRKDIGDVSVVYYLEDESQEGHIICRGVNGIWWHLWLTFQGGRMIDVEYAPVDGQAGT